MEYLYCGGTFHFDYQNENYRMEASQDYRAIILGGLDGLLRNDGVVKLSERASYVGPFYFESDGMVDRTIVSTEKAQVEACTTAIFLLEDARCPGTVGEMIYAAALGKKIRIFYVRDDRETESTLHAPCWYPMILSDQIDPDNVEMVPCCDYAEAKQRAIAYIREVVFPAY